MSWSGLRRRYHQGTRIVHEGGARELGLRVLNGLAWRLDTGRKVLPVRPDDVLAADLSARPRWSLLSSPTGRLIVNWVSTPPSAGSGGHTTMFRLIEHLEAAGHLCRLYVYDVHGSRAADLEESVRKAFPHFRGPVLDVGDGMADADAVFATAWTTAYPTYNDRCAGRRFYLVQDYEPWFFPVGGLATLAENTYRMGFHGFTAGRFLADKLASEFGMVADGFEFGCDTRTYRLLPGEQRGGIVFYARRNAPRRATELGLMALELFSDRHPGVDLHLYGEKLGLGGRYIDHGLLPTEELNVIYNRCRAGLSLSMTNVSLVPHEMLAAGCIPVVNDAPHNRVVLDNNQVRYTAPTPHALATALSDLVVAPVPAAAEAAAAASRSVRERSWDAAGEQLEKLLVRELAR